MKDKLFPLPSDVPVTTIEELRAERRDLERLLDATPYIVDQPHGLRRRRNTILAELERREAQGDGGPLLTVTLDAYASAIVRRIMREEPDATRADVVNASLVFTHGEADDHDWSGERGELAAAIRRRRAWRQRKGLGESASIPSRGQGGARVQRRPLDRDAATGAGPGVLRSRGGHLANRLGRLPPPRCFGGRAVLAMLPS